MPTTTGCAPSSTRSSPPRTLTGAGKIRGRPPCPGGRAPRPVRPCSPGTPDGRAPSTRRSDARPDSALPRLGGRPDRRHKEVVTSARTQARTRTVCRRPPTTSTRRPPAAAGPARTFFRSAPARVRDRLTRETAARALTCACRVGGPPGAPCTEHRAPRPSHRRPEPPTVPHPGPAGRRPMHREPHRRRGGTVPWTGAGDGRCVGADDPWARRGAQGSARPGDPPTTGLPHGRRPGGAAGQTVRPGC